MPGLPCPGLSKNVIFCNFWVPSTRAPMSKNCQFKKNGSHKWETIWESTESVERNVNGLRQMDIRIHLRDKSFRSWDPFVGEK